MLAGLKQTIENETWFIEHQYPAYANPIFVQNFLTILRYSHRRLQTLAVLIGCLALVLGVVSCTHSPHKVWIGLQSTPSLKGNAPRETNNLIVYDHAGELVSRYYYDTTMGGKNWAEILERHRPTAQAATNDEVLYEVINAALTELPGSHLGAQPPDVVRAQKRFRANHLSYTGMLTMELEGSASRVVYEVAPGGSADLAGVKKGWLCLSGPERADPDVQSYEGEITKWRFLDNENILRELDLVFHLGSSTRAQHVEMVRPDGLVYLRFDGFTSENEKWLRSRLREHREAPGIILDLRFNTGGASSELAWAVGEFFEEPIEIGRFIDRNSGSFPTLSKTSWGSARYQGPLAILVGKTSASAAEILPAALQHAGRALIVSGPSGHTSGAVLMSIDLKLPGGGKLQVPIRDFVMPDGTRLEGIGVQADIAERAPTLEDIRSGFDPGQERAAAELLARIETAAAETATP